MLYITFSAAFLKVQAPPKIPKWQVAHGPSLSSSTVSRVRFTALVTISLSLEFTCTKDKRDVELNITWSRQFAAQTRIDKPVLSCKRVEIYARISLNSVREAELDSAMFGDRQHFIAWVFLVFSKNFHFSEFVWNTLGWEIYTEWGICHNERRVL